MSYFENIVYQIFRTQLIADYPNIIVFSPTEKNNLKDKVF